MSVFFVGEGNARADTNCIPVPEGLVSWWRGEGSMADSFGSNHLQAPYGTNYVTGKVGLAFGEYTPLESLYLVAFDAPSLRFSNAMTVAAWVRPRVLGGYDFHTIIAKVDSLYPGASQFGYYLGTTSNGVPFFRVSADGSPNGNGIVTAVSPLPTNEWSFIAASYDGSGLRMYTNGALAADVAFSGGIFPGTAELTIGQTRQGEAWLGDADEIALFSRALADTEVEALYGATGGMCEAAPWITVQPVDQVAHAGQQASFWCAAMGTPPLKYQWSFNGSPIVGATNQTLVVAADTNTAGLINVAVSNGAGTAVSSNAVLALGVPGVCMALPEGSISWWPGDGTGGNLTGTNTADVLGGSYVTGKVGRAFDLTTQYVAVPNSPALNFSSNVDFSIEVWITSFGAFRDPNSQLIYPFVSVVEKRGSNGAGYMLGLYKGRVAFWLGAAGQTGATAPLFWAAEPDLQDGQWHHLAVSVKRAAFDGGKLYLDGQNVVTFDPTQQAGDLSNTGLLNIGETEVATNSYFSGYIDELTIYNRALTSTEVQGIFQAGSLGKCKGAPLLSISHNNLDGTLVLSWPATGFGLYESQSLSAAVNWTAVTNAIDNSPDGVSRITVPPDGPNGFFRLGPPAN